MVHGLIDCASVFRDLNVVGCSFLALKVFVSDISLNDEIFRESRWFQVGRFDRFYWFFTEFYCIL